MSYKLQYTLDGVKWDFVDNERVFKGNVNGVKTPVF
jgi:hypothetical protein